MNEVNPTRPHRLWPAVLAVAATYAYFLLFAEFAFLKQARAVLGSEAGLRGIMAALGAGGVAGSVVAFRRYRPENFVTGLCWSYAACAVAAALAPLTTGPLALTVVAAGIGLALGCNTVTLASGLRSLLPDGRLGWGIGFGTGAAYAFCNVPVIFTASVVAQVWISAGVAALAALALSRAQPVWRQCPAPTPVALTGRWVGVFLALVWLDSAVFYIIQQTPGLHDLTWTGTIRLWGNVAVHLVAAVAAGWLLDRGWLRGIAGAAWVALAGACLLLASSRPVAEAGWLYAGGVSLYSTALVFFAAREGRAWVAAAVFAVAGWMGSALGIGMAQDLHGVPVAFVLVSGLGLVFALRPWRRAALAGVALLVGVRPARAGSDEMIVRGREVYIAEGCMHCHSQYVRPGVKTDVERWGPAHPLEELLQQGPPLPGNRRQGPDLTNIGNRRSPEWNRLHLQAPRAVSPGSRMPSYAHLFSSGDDRGEALVAYLASLGADAGQKHWSGALAWQPAAGTVPVIATEAARLFQQNCAQCHGPEGRGDGPLAAQLASRPPDWSREAWRRAPDGDEAWLARLIKFGAPGTPMPGHEAFADAEILGLARQVKLLHK